jgi:ATP-dependent Clp protease ATP-binding subunit ClpB
LLGAPPGYVGYEEAGQLTEAVRRRPYAVVLFDDVEKAHPEVFNGMLQLLDDGRLTDGKGRTVDFKNVVVIMTSNVRDQEALRAQFRPEFLNRIDEIVYFDPLTKADIRKVIDIQLRGLLKRLEERKITLEMSDSARDLLVDEGYDPVYGARPLKRTLQKRVLDPLALGLLQGDFVEGDTVYVEAVDGKIALHRVVAA